MRYCVFGQGEGVHSDCSDPVWATVNHQRVTDASISARKLGIRSGMTEATVKAMNAQAKVLEKGSEPSETMKRVWNLLWNRTPWLETVQEDSFSIQLPGIGHQPPFAEVKQLLTDLNHEVSVESRFRLGLAENPFFARALVAWSRYERVPGALYRKVNRQQWLVSPGLVSAGDSSHPHRQAAAWIRTIPIGALWLLSEQTRERLIRLGIVRLQDLLATPSAVLEQHFGKEALWWLRLLEQAPKEPLRVNYPPVERREVWHAPLGESVPLESVMGILTPLVQSVAASLERYGMGALKIGVCWTTDIDHGERVKLSKRPLVQTESMLIHLAPLVATITGRTLEGLEVFVEDIRPLTAIQSSFVIHKGILMSSQAIERDELRKVLNQVNHKFPRSLQLGLRPRLRELRQQALEQTHINRTYA